MHAYIRTYIDTDTNDTGLLVGMLFCMLKPFTNKKYTFHAVFCSAHTVYSHPLYWFVCTHLCVLVLVSSTANEDPVGKIMGPAYASTSGVSKALLEAHEHLSRERMKGNGEAAQLDSSFRLLLVLNALDVKLLHSSVEKMGKYVHACTVHTYVLRHNVHFICIIRTYVHMYCVHSRLLCC